MAQQQGQTTSPFPRDMASVEENFFRCMRDRDAELTGRPFEQTQNAGSNTDSALDSEHGHVDALSPQHKGHIAPLPAHVPSVELEKSRADELLNEAPGALYSVLEKAEDAGVDLGFARDATRRSGTASYQETLRGVYDDEY